jgi:hypothetical protein
LAYPSSLFLTSLFFASKAEVWTKLWPTQFTSTRHSTLF